MNKLHVFFGVLVLAGCSKEPPPPKPVMDSGRPETRSLEAADAVGYNGKQVRQKVDAALDANDAHNADMAKQIEENQ